MEEIVDDCDGVCVLDCVPVTDWLGENDGLDVPDLVPDGDGEPDRVPVLVGVRD